jgi:hypothetical protein
MRTVCVVIKLSTVDAKVKSTHRRLCFFFGGSFAFFSSSLSFSLSSRILLATPFLWRVQWRSKGTA